MMSEYTFGVIIPTLDRPAKLQTCVRLIAEQERPPEEVIIIDDGGLEQSVQTNIRETLDDIPVTITSSDGPPSTSTAINTGVRVASTEIVLTIADDMRLGSGYIERLEELYKRYDSDTLAGIGVAGDTDSLGGNTRSLVDLHNRVFYRIQSEWKINAAGFQKAVTVDEPTRSDWIVGGGASYKRELLLEHPFRHWEGGREVHEDIELCWRLKREGYDFVVDPKLPTSHDKGERHDSGFRTGIKKGRNRVRMFRDNGKIRHVPLFLWGCIGLILGHLAQPLFNKNDAQYRFLAAFGVVVGVIQQFPSIFTQRGADYDTQ